MKGMQIRKFRVLNKKLVYCFDCSYSKVGSYEDIIECDCGSK